MKRGIALRRFGLCGNESDVVRLGDDPRGALIEEVAVSQRTPPTYSPELLTTEKAATLFAGRREKVVALRGKISAEEMSREMSAFDGIRTGTVRLQELRELVRRGMSSPFPLAERIGLFWSSHFTVSTVRQAVASMVGAYEREALRPHMLNRFEDLLKAATLHPVMLRYLDNHVSTGPNSPGGRGRRMVNENLAREVLELHTLGVDGGYSQADVTAFAMALSGWSAGIWSPGRSDTLGTFFDAGRHEPGPKVILGHTYADSGPDQASSILLDLARHPSTIRHVSRKLAIHFVGDQPPQAVTDSMEKAWRRTDGELRAVVEAMLLRPQVWEAPMAKLRPPIEFVMATCRTLDQEMSAPGLLRDIEAMGQPVFSATSPKGWPDENDAWVSPDGVKTRLDWSLNVAAQAAGHQDPRRLADSLFGVELAAATRRAIARSESPKQGIAIFLMAPEMQRR